MRNFSPTLPEVDVLLSVVERLLVGEEVVDALVSSHLRGTDICRRANDDQYPNCITRFHIHRVKKRIHYFRQIISHFEFSTGA